MVRGDSPIPANFETHTLIPIYEVLSWLTFQKVGRGNISSASAVNYSWMWHHHHHHHWPLRHFTSECPEGHSVMVSAWKRLGSAWNVPDSVIIITDYAALVKFRFSTELHDSDCAEVADR